MSVIMEAAERQLADEPSLELRLVCGRCGKGGNYRVGEAVIDLDRFVEDPDEAVAFTGIFRCAHCAAEGPWKVPALSRMTIMARKLLGRDLVSIGTIGMFDGTVVRSGAEAVRHLRALLADDPENAFLWDRLGNACLTGGALGEAVRAWERALELDPEEIRSRFSLGRAAFELDLFAEAVPHLHAVLALARKKTGSIPLSHLRAFVREAVLMLLDIRERLGEDVPLFPRAEPRARADGRPAVLRLTSYDLSREEDRDRFADDLLGLGAVSSALRAAPGRGRERRKRPW